MRRLACGALLLMAAAACGGPAPQLAALQEEIAQLEEDGLLLVDEHAQDQKEGLLGKPVRARVRRSYVVDEAESAERTVRALVARAAADGWQIPTEPHEVLGGLSWPGTKPVDGTEVSLTISLLTDPHVVPPDTRPPVVQLDMIHPYDTS